METLPSRIHAGTWWRIALIAVASLAAWLWLAFYLNPVVALFLMVTGLFAVVPVSCVVFDVVLRRCRCPRCGVRLSRDEGLARDNHYQYTCNACRVRWVSPVRWYPPGIGGG